MVEWKELGKVCTIKRGKSLSKADKDLGDVPFILYGELYTTYGNYIKKVVSYKWGKVIILDLKVFDVLIVITYIFFFSVFFGVHWGFSKNNIVFNGINS